MGKFICEVREGLRIYSPHSVRTSAASQATRVLTPEEADQLGIPRREYVISRPRGEKARDIAGSQE
jgi:hypothetical protein